jgi:asparagine synthase (glutamine-hydrolysing)
MSGIAGACFFDGRKAEAPEIGRMLDAMPHRGVDGQRVWTEASVGLGQSMMFTTRESQREALPLTGRKGCTIVADARIDNRAELCRTLRPPGEPTDGELILAAYEAWGERCVEHLVGDFAFAVYDAPERKLLCARDHFGMRPLYYHYAAGRVFAFGTEIKALLALPEVPRRLDEVCVGNFLANIRDDLEPTIYEAVRRLPNAHVLVADERGVRTRCYYELQPAEDVRPRNDAEYAERFRELFEEAVRCRIRSAYPVGSHLSGGLDSSSVAGVARDVLREEGRGPLHTFSVVFDESRVSDEQEYIDMVLAQGGSEAHYVNGDALGPLSNLEELYSFLDEGLVGGPQHLVWALTKKVSEVGVRVVLDGLDGDSTVDHGTLYLRELARRGDWAEFRRQGVRMAERYRGATHRQDFQDRFSSFATLFSGFGLPELDALAERGAWREFVRSLNAAHRHIPFDRSIYLRSTWRKLAAPNALIRWRRARREAASVRPLPFVDPGVAAELRLRERYREHVVELPETTVRESQQTMLGARRRVASLEVLNQVAAAYGVEPAHPFYDIRLIEYCLALPPQQSLDDGWPRVIQRRAMAGILPEQIAWRVGKAVMAPNFERGLFGVDGERLRTHLTEPGPLEPYLDMESVAEALEKGKGLSERQQVQLARIATLAYWLKQRFGDENISEREDGRRDPGSPAPVQRAAPGNDARLRRTED